MAVRVVTSRKDASRPSRPELPPQRKRLPVATPSLADQFRRIVKEFDDEKKLANDEAEKGKTPFEKWKIRGEKSPDETSYARRIVDLAATNPKRSGQPRRLDLGDRQALSQRSGTFGDEVQRAVNLLVDHHADDPEVARLGLGLANLVTRRRDAFLEGIYANAEGTRGEGTGPDGTRPVPGKKGRRSRERQQVQEPERRPVSDAMTSTANLWKRPIASLQRRGRVPRSRANARPRKGPPRSRATLRGSHRRNTATFPTSTTHHRELERRARETPSASCTDPKEREAMRADRGIPPREKLRTLAEVAAARLDDMRNLAVGKLAPDFEGVGVDGKPLKLSDHRGKVVALDLLVFELRTVPAERFPSSASCPEDERPPVHAPGGRHRRCGPKTPRR